MSSLASRTGLSPSMMGRSRALPFTIDVQQRGPTTPAARYHVAGLGCSPVARHYWGNHCLFSFPRGTKMFQFPRLASRIKARSEEHTSELQSRQYLVCRLLLEK